VHTITKLTQVRLKPLYLAQVGLLAVIYFATAKAGLSLSPVSGFATLVWPPTGIALAALFLFGWRLWPGIFLGAALINVATGAPLLVAIGIGVGNTLEPVVGAYLLRRFGFQSKLSRVQDVAKLIGYAALFSTLISATIGTSSLLLGGTITLSAYSRTWIAWWIGDMLGDLIAAPLVLVWVQTRNTQFKPKHLIEALGLVALFFAVGMIVFGGIFSNVSAELRSAPYLLFPLLIWAVLRFRARIIIMLNFGLAALTVFAAIYSRGPFIGKTLDDRLFSSQLFIGISAITFLLFSAAISERRHAQAESHKLNTQLTKALARSTAELLKEKEVEKLKDEFVAIASHELKTPITSIKDFARILDEKLTNDEDRKIAFLADSIDKQADKLTRFIEELLDVSRIESGNLVLYTSKFDLTSLLKKIITDFQYTLQKHKIIKEIGSRQYIIGDQNRLEQVILNLLANAVKYSPKADKIVVKLSVDHNEVVVGIKDFGPGIPKKDLTRIFDRFYRTAESSKKQQAVSGIGLGLYITSEIIKQHGGKVWVESKLGKGSTFNFSLPIG
jgi:signal transduction histidine kinase